MAGRSMRRLVLLPAIVFTITAVALQIVIPRLYEERLVTALSQSLTGLHDTLVSELIQLKRTAA